MLNINVPTFEYKSGIDPKVVMVLTIAAFAITAIAFGAKFLGAL